MSTPTTEPDNIRRWSADAPGVYEVWYTTWNHPGTDQGFWLRFITEAPTIGSGGVPPFGEAPRGELWFARFDPRRPERTFGIHKRFADVVSKDDPFRVTIAGCELGHDHSFGELSGNGHDVRWDLRWTPSAHTLRFYPDALYRAESMTPTTALAPNPRVPLSGTLMIDGEELSFDRAIAGQSHVWGKKHGYAWTWAHCGEIEDAPGAMFELIGARLKRGGIMLPTTTALSLDLDGERYRFNQLRHLFVNSSSWGVGRVTFTGRSTNVKVEGELTCSPDDMVNAPYVDPDGTELWCANTEIAHARLVVYRRSGLRWREHRRLEARHRAHFEVGGRVRDPSVTRPHVLVT